MIINNKEDFEEFYPYDKKYIRDYPKEYPCICKWVYESGGLAGDYKKIYVAYFPKNTTPNESFLIGLKSPWEILN